MIQNFLFNILIPFISGSLFYFVVKYIIFKYSLYKNTHLFTKDISKNEITFVEDYQRILQNKLGENPGYFVIHAKTKYYLMKEDWSVYDIKDWLDSLNDIDYSVRIEILSKTFEGLFEKDLIIEKEIIINNQSDPVLISTYISTCINNIYKLANKEIEDNQYICILYTELKTSN